MEFSNETVGLDPFAEAPASSAQNAEKVPFDPFEHGIFFIVNPVAGSGRCERLFAEAERVFAASGVRYSLEFTKGVGHAERLAASAIERGERYIVAVGGDGTVREVASALAGRTGVFLGILPFGTGNDLASCLSIPHEPSEAAELILHGTPKSCDLGSANGRVFTNVCGLGFDVDVLHRVAKSRRGRSGMLPYVLGIVGALLHRKRLRARITLDGGREIETDAVIICVCNGRRFGGGMLVAPDARQDDGELDVMIAKWVGFFHFLTLLPLFIKGRHINKKPITYLRSRSVSVRLVEGGKGRVNPDGAETVELDGELLERAPLECSTLPGAILLVHP